MGNFSVSELHHRKLTNDLSPSNLRDGALDSDVTLGYPRQSLVRQGISSQGVWGQSFECFGQTPGGLEPPKVNLHAYMLVIMTMY